MKTFSIRELETLCDVKAHTIRVWEKRYGVFQPQRTAANARRYTADDLAKLLNFALLTKSGSKISSVSQLPATEAQQQAQHLVQSDARVLRAVHELILRMYKLDVAGVESTLDTAFLSWPVDFVASRIIYPFLERVGLFCQGRRLNEEHFVVTAVRKKLYWSIQRTVSNKKKDRTVLLFLSGERQLDLLLLYVYYLLEAAGYQVVHLGVDVSVKNLEDFMRVQRVDFLLTYFSKKPVFSLPDLSEKIEELAPQAKLLVLKAPRCFLPGATGTASNVLIVDTDGVLPALSAAQTSETAPKQTLNMAFAL